MSDHAHTPERPPEPDLFSEEQAVGGVGEVPPLPPARRSFFTPLRCCGLLALFAGFVTIAGLVAVKMALDIGLPRTPIDVPEVAYTPEEARPLTQRLQAAMLVGEEVALTPRELTVLVQNALDETENLGAQSRFHCEVTPDGLLDLRLSLEIPEDWRLIGGRFLNLTLIGTLTIEEGQVVSAKLQRYQWGGSEDAASYDAESSKQQIESIKEWTNLKSEVRAQVDRLRSFQFDGERIRFTVDPDE